MTNKNLEAFKQQQLRKCQLKQVDILIEIDRICKKHQLTYWLDGGTLLGAVRHGGFVPWDDDIDIAMPLADLQKFLHIAPQELPPHLLLQSPLLHHTQLKEPITKVRDLNSFYVEASDNFAADYEKGLFVDIFPFIPYPSIPRKWVKRITKAISKSYSILHKAHYYSLRSTAEFFWFGASYCFHRVLWSVLTAVSPTKDYISNVLVNNGYGIMHRNDSVFPVQPIAFEGIDFMAPSNPDAYLSDLYRNYMEIPPEDKRKIHAIFVLPTLIEE